MLYFNNDYDQGTHPEILERLTKINFDHQVCYGMDPHSKHAGELIAQACGNKDAEIFFIAGGTQTNQTVISSVLNNYECVIAAKTGHISLHEAGAIEYSGHKVQTLEQYNGKLRAEDIDEYMNLFVNDSSHEHMPQPAMVYISHPTEYGTLYTKKELEDISIVCDKYGLRLYLDGARMAYGLMAKNTDVTLNDIAKYCDVFYIGGTKIGCLFGEAVVFSKSKAPKHFVTSIKQHGAMLAKGWLAGVQFEVMFEDGLYFRAGQHAIDMAQKLSNLLVEKGYKLFVESPTNQIFVLLKDDEFKALSEKIVFGFWEKPDKEHTVARFVTSWATKEEDIQLLADVL